MATLRDLAIRFCPYLKFSTDQGDEPCTPCTWQWLGQHSKHPDTYLATMTRADVRVPGGIDDGANIEINSSSHGGPGWTDVRNGDALYCHVSSIDRGNLPSTATVNPHELVNLEFWLVIPYNHSATEDVIQFDPGILGPLTSKLSHLGDLVCVQMLYDSTTDHIVRVSFPIHGIVMVAFDLTGARQEAASLSGTDANKKAITWPAMKYTMTDDAAYQKGDDHTPGAPEVYFAQDPVTHEYSHLAVFIEWGTHEVWPNPSGSVLAAPKHGGDSYSFLPGATAPGKGANVHVLEGAEDEPFIYFGGRFGDPRSAILHKSWLLAESTPVISKNQRHDLDPYQDYGKLTWLPAGVAGEQLTISAHIQDVGDATFHQGQLAGTTGKSKRLEGFQISFASPIAGLTMEYMVQPENGAPGPWTEGGFFVGSKGQSQALEGFAIRLAGPQASHYNVIYTGYVQDYGTTGLSRNGGFCGVHGKRLEGIWVVVRKANDLERLDKHLPDRVSPIRH